MQPDATLIEEAKALEAQGLVDDNVQTTEDKLRTAVDGVFDDILEEDRKHVELGNEIEELRKELEDEGPEEKTKEKTGEEAEAALKEGLANEEIKGLKEGTEAGEGTDGQTDDPADPDAGTENPGSAIQGSGVFTLSQVGGVPSNPRFKSAQDRIRNALAARHALEQATIKRATEMYDSVVTPEVAEQELRKMLPELKPLPKVEELLPAENPYTHELEAPIDPDTGLPILDPNGDPFTPATAQYELRRLQQQQQDEKRRLEEQYKAEYDKFIDQKQELLNSIGRSVNEDQVATATLLLEHPELDPESTGDIPELQAKANEFWEMIFNDFVNVLISDPKTGEQIKSFKDSKELTELANKFLEDNKEFYENVAKNQEELRKKAMAQQAKLAKEATLKAQKETKEAKALLAPTAKNSTGNPTKPKSEEEKALDMLKGEFANLRKSNNSSGTASTYSIFNGDGRVF